jgi:hypothetical protein
MIRLRQIIHSTTAPVVETADRPEEQSIMRLSPRLADEIERKIDIMNRHWRDYGRLFTEPNL